MIDDQIRAQSRPKFRERTLRSRTLSAFRVRPFLSSRWRYAGAAALAALAFWIRFALQRHFGPDTPILVSIIAVALSAWAGGFGPGFLATGLGFAGGIALIVPPLGNEPTLTLLQVLRLLLFLLTGAIVSGLTEALNQTTTAWRRAEQEQENRVLQERNRMAREIHDTLAQGLTGIIVQLEAAEDMLVEAPPEALSDALGHIARAQNLARHSLTEARRSVQALRPQMLEERDLAGALAHYAEQMTSGTGVRAEVRAEGIPPDFLSAEMQSDLLRIGVEALTNALKHARADTVTIDLTYTPNRVTLSVKDNGRGFVPHAPLAGGSAGGFGLTGMWERAERIGGQFTLGSRHGEGTEVTVTVAAPPASKSIFGGGRA